MTADIDGSVKTLKSGTIDSKYLCLQTWTNTDMFQPRTNLSFTVCTVNVSLGRNICAKTLMRSTKPQFCPPNPTTRIVSLRDTGYIFAEVFNMFFLGFRSCWHFLLLRFKRTIRTNIFDFAMTARFFFVMLHTERYVSFLFGAAAAPPSSHPRRQGETALHAAARNGHGAVVEQLISAGAEVDAASEDGRGPRVSMVELCWEWPRGS